MTNHSNDNVYDYEHLCSDEDVFISKTSVEHAYEDILHQVINRKSDTKVNINVSSNLSAGNNEPFPFIKNIYFDSLNEFNTSNLKIGPHCPERIVHVIE